MARIRLMGDDVTVSFALSSALRSAGHDVDTARFASEALALLQQADYDLLITDIIVRTDEGVVPDGGLLLISRLRIPGRKLLRNTDIPIIAISGAVSHMGLGHILKTPRDLGANGALAKPIDVPTLLAEVRSHLST
ncbi:MAG: response regulator [Pseudomonadota bacterium]